MRVLVVGGSGAIGRRLLPQLATAGHQVTHTAQHLHGGLGADVEYPIHAFFLRAKQLELSLGGATQMLAEIGAQLAGDGVPAFT